MNSDDLLIPYYQYIDAGVHIGTLNKTQDMIPYIYRTSRSGINIINIQDTDSKIRIAAKFISQYKSDRILIVSSRKYGHLAIKKCSELINSRFAVDRFIPGTLTSQYLIKKIEIDLIIITDPNKDKQALNESTIAKIPTIALCDTDNYTTNLDLIIPTNNRGQKALALIYWLLTRQVLLERREILSFDEFKFSFFDFMYKI